MLCSVSVEHEENPVRQSSGTCRDDCHIGLLSKRLLRNLTFFIGRLSKLSWLPVFDRIALNAWRDDWE